MSEFQPKFESLVQVFNRSIEKFGDRALFGVKRDGQWHWMTYGEWGNRVRRLRTALQLLGVGPGVRVAIISNNSPEWAFRWSRTIARSVSFRGRTRLGKPSSFTAFSRWARRSGSPRPSTRSSPTWPRCDRRCSSAFRVCSIASTTAFTPRWRFGGRLKYAFSGGAAISREVAELIDNHGHNIMEGYHNLDEANAEVLVQKNGLRGFRSGDMGVVDDERFLHMTGRVKEQYKLLNGKYVVPTPLEM